MDNERVIVTFQMVKRKQTVDIDIPLNISADELVKALNAAYSLGIDTDNPRNCYLQAENPIVLLKGKKKLWECGSRNGSLLRFTE